MEDPRLLRHRRNSDPREERPGEDRRLPPERLKGDEKTAATGQSPVEGVVQMAFQGRASGGEADETTDACT